MAKKKLKSKKSAKPAKPKTSAKKSSPTPRKGAASTPFSKAFAVFQKWAKPFSPQAHVVLGSGFGAALDKICAENPRYQLRAQLSFTKIPGLPGSTVVDHAGAFRIVEDTKTGKNVVFQQGRIHGYEGHSPALAVWPVMLSRALGIDTFLLTNAAGGIARNFHPGDAMLIKDQVNMTGLNPLTGENPTNHLGSAWGPRFPDMSQVYHATMTADLKLHLEKSKVRVQEGIYLGINGPSFETPSEVRLFSQWNMQAVGMSTVWEGIALKHSGAKIAGISLISNMACGIIEGQTLEHEDIVKTCRASAESIMNGILSWLSST